MNNKWLIAIVAVVGALILGGILFTTRTAAPPAEQTNTQTQTTPATPTSSVTIDGGAFSPAAITVKKGTTVTWTNQDSTDHNVVSDTSAPAGGPPQEADLLGQGERFSFTYNMVGTFPYHCAPHPFMQGTVEVTD